MAERILGPTGSRRRRRFLFVPMLLVSAVALMFVAGAQAVHDEVFQLDGDVVASTTTTVPPGPTPPAETQLFDWDSLFNADGSTKSSLPTGFENADLTRDFNTNAAETTFLTNDGTTFSTGSKDTLPISGWQCNLDNNVNSKIDVMNAYAATYTATDGDEILYFGMERNVNTGDANVGFWFLQSAVGCVSTGPSVTFSGEHQDGDLLIVSEFSGGGTVSTINVYRWNRPDPALPGSLGTTAVAAGVDCRSATTPVDDTACGASNRETQSPITIPWLGAVKTTLTHSLSTALFFEGGVNLTRANLAGKCFNTFLADTRSSTSLTATLFDFTAGQLGACQTGIVTTPQTGAGGSIPAAGISIGTSARVEVRDQAVITVNGTTGPFAGTVKFFLCGPLALDSTSNCSTGGVQIGTPAAGETVSGNNGTATVNSDTATLTSAGDYCWRAEYSGDSAVGVPGSTDPTNTTTRTECFQVNPVQPVLTTTAGADVTLGNPITDTASLTGTAKQPGTDGVGPGGTINATAATQANAGGTITFSVRGPDSCTESGLTVTGSPVTVNGDNTSYGPVSATPTALGTYTFVATYSGNSPNTRGVAGSCPPAAGDGDEVVIVSGAATLATAQKWLPNDTAHITGPAGTTLSGTVTFTLYNDGSCGTGGGTSQFSQSRDVVTDADTTPAPTANDRFVSTTNTSFLVTTANDAVAWSWKVSYNDANLTDPADKCETTTPAFTLAD
jgi:hypothetical protein